MHVEHSLVEMINNASFLFIKHCVNFGYVFKWNLVACNAHLLYTVSLNNRTRCINAFT